ncbi:MAG: mercury resistance system transport protein MerF [Rhodospirillales bacterium]|jgi:mercuric ion transport protein|nr:mercury resistance system transport protein MerF [Rhodospirillales bacterium]MDP7214799.1 mercury resistance system transport protein MerF [Rhodospirillales bacterium]HIJ93474.1 mercury resistance system transport protein MerF [Rhodospirillaceae bacterium]HJP53484.1 mercury resistance system transport protein MerF [Rhodospirillales bacterium]
MIDMKLLHTGIIGSAIAAVCCFTPLLVILFAAVGLSSWMGWWLDYFLLFPALAFFLALTGLAIYRMRRQPAAERRAANANADSREAS